MFLAPIIQLAKPCASPLIIDTPKTTSGCCSPNDVSSNELSRSETPEGTASPSRFEGQPPSFSSLHLDVSDNSTTTSEDVQFVDEPLDDDVTGGHAPVALVTGGQAPVMTSSACYCPECFRRNQQMITRKDDDKAIKDYQTQPTVVLGWTKDEPVKEGPNGDLRRFVAKGPSESVIRNRLTQNCRLGMKCKKSTSECTRIHCVPNRAQAEYYAEQLRIGAPGFNTLGHAVCRHRLRNITVRCHPVKCRYLHFDVRRPLTEAQEYAIRMPMPKREVAWQGLQSLPSPLVTAPITTSISAQRFLWVPVYLLPPAMVVQQLQHQQQHPPQQQQQQHPPIGPD